ncbi:tetratricopeptide repeat protein 17 [Vanessa cardui]|uniref:tetratricopeptide repeat protein 17 n=1 Tax=Vanessa cardui TaxID=171605 RepID=UPI001F137634|nr:tetratricopeptide repeat protein 17 [Vanessa cardui]
MLFAKLPCLFIACVLFFYEIHASNHWMVTESGLIQPRLDSPFEMARPYDLLAFLNQEQRWDSISDLFNDLINRQIEIDKLWANVRKYTDVGRQIAQNDDCIKAGNVNIIDWYAALLEDGSNKIHPNEFLLPNPYYGPNSDIPDCKRISSLPFSMSAFEHLESLRNRVNLTANPEFVLPELISPIMSLGQYGHWLTGVLRRNSSSWLHYHMASLYWRVRGSATKAIECSRRALHYVPRVFKDVALGSLGMVLHRCSKTNDAIVVLNAAVEHDPKNYVSHFSIANAYTVIGEFNTSLKYYDQTLKLNPRMELAIRHKYGVLCHAKLAVRIKAIRETLNKLRGELHEYKLKEAAWPKMQAEFLRTLKNGDDFDYRNKEKNSEKMSLITGLDIKKLKNYIEKNSLIKYFIDGPLYSDETLGKQGIDAMETIYNLEKLIKNINKNGRNAAEITSQTEKPIEINNFNDKPSPAPSIPEYPFPNEAKPVPHTNEKKVTKIPRESLSEYETGIFMYASITINRNVEDFDKEIEWPSDELCKNVPRMPKSLDAVIPVFLPFENKGIRMRSLLTEKLGVPLTEEHELPWHPPVCALDRDAAHYAHKKNRQSTPEIVDTDYMRTKLLEYVSDGNVEAAKHMQEAEIGQRIYVAMKKKLAPKWMLLTLSSLYWRVRKNNINALHCLHNAVRWVQEEYKDLVLVSLGSVYLEMGYYDEALATADAAFRLSLYEPATNFLLAQINVMKKNHNTHMFHLKQTLRVEARYMAGLARNLLTNWACLMKQLSNLKEMDMGEGDICTHVKPMVNVVCEKDGENCQMSNIQCFSSHDRADTSKLVSLLRERERRAAGELHAGFFDEFVARAPAQRADRLAHRAHYDALLRTTHDALRGCGPAGCHNLKPEDMSMKEQDCSYHHFQLGYWLHIVSFRQLLTDSDVELPTEITLVTPSNKKVPECRIIGDPMEDFITEKLTRVSTEGWEPVLSLMHQLAEMFDSFDYVTLGAKIAKYVEMRPNSWTGALVAGWWCGAGGRGACAVRCARAAYALASRAHAHYALRALVALLHVLVRAAYALASRAHAHYALRALVALLHVLVRAAYALASRAHAHYALRALVALLHCVRVQARARRLRAGVARARALRPARARGAAARVSSVSVYRLVRAAYALASRAHAHYALRALVALLHVQSKQLDAKEVAYLSFYMSPKSKIEAFLVAVSHSYLAEYEQAVWMYRYALAFDEKFIPAKACLHATMCLMFYGDNQGKVKEE